jgi:hypothetical protein
LAKRDAKSMRDDAARTMTCMNSRPPIISTRLAHISDGRQFLLLAIGSEAALNSLDADRRTKLALLAITAALGEPLDQGAKARNYLARKPASHTSLFIHGSTVVNDTVESN